MTGRLLQKIGIEAVPVNIQEEESVCAYLQELFNTPQGGHGACPDFGVPPITRIEDIKQAISTFKDCIKNYEPRLRELTSGSYDPNEKAVWIKAKLVTRDTQSKEGVPVNVRIAVGDTSKVKVLIERL
jgi:predicted component of type VI protein secretion system